MEEISEKLIELRELLEEVSDSHEERTKDLYRVVSKTQKQIMEHIEDEEASIHKVIHTQQIQHEVIDTHISTSIEAFKALTSNMEGLRIALNGAITAYQKSLWVAFMIIMILAIDDILSINSYFLS